MGDVAKGAAAGFVTGFIKGFITTGGNPFAALGIAAFSAIIAAGQASRQKKPRGPDFTSEARERTVVIRSSVAPRRAVYGEAQVSGPLVYAESSPSGVTKNQFLNLVIPLAHGYSEEIGLIYFNEVPLNETQGFFRSHGFGGGNLVDLERNLGAADQLASAKLLGRGPNWTSEHRLQGVTYLYVRLGWNPNVWVSGIPNIKAVVRGRRLYDPRAATVSIVDSQVGGPAIINTGAAHGLSPGDHIWIKDHSGSVPALTKAYQVNTVPTTTSLTVLGTDGLPLGVSTGGTGGALIKMAWSDNPALALLDYLTATIGFGIDQEEVDEATFIAAANICDEMVELVDSSVGFTADAATDTMTLANTTTPIRRGDGVEVSSSGALPGGLAAATTYYFMPAIPTIATTGDDAGTITQVNFKLATSRANALAGTAIDITGAGTGSHTITRKSQVRYDLNGVITLDARPIDVAKELLSAMAGVLIYTQGTFKLYAAVAGTASVTLTEDDLRGPLELRGKTPRSELFNTVRGTFVDPDDVWQPKDFPLVKNANYVSQDGGDEITRDLELPFTTDVTRAQRLAKIHLERGRRGQTVQFSAKLSALQIAPWDMVNLDITKFATVWGGTKTFRVVDWRLSDDLGVDLTLKEEDAAIYAWTSTDATDAPPVVNTILPDASVVLPPTGVTATSGNDQLFVSGDGTVHARIRLTWTPPDDATARWYELEWKLVSETEFSRVRLGEGATEYTIAPANDGDTYDIRIRSISGLQVPSPYVTIQHIVAGKSAVPPDVETFTVARLPDGTRKFEWSLASPPPDVRVGGGYQIKYQSGTSLTWASSTDLHTGLLIASPFESNALAAGTYTFGIKAIDSSGNESTTAQTITATLGDPRIRDALHSRIEQDLDWPGTKTDCFINVEGVLEAASNGDWNSLPATWSALADAWHEIVAGKSPVTYETPVVDLGADLTFMPLVTVESNGTDVIKMKTGTSTDGGVVGIYGALGQATGKRYIQFQIQTTATNVLITSVVIILDGEVLIDDFEDVNTASEAAAWFESVAAGHFKVEIRKDLANITQAQVAAIQNVGAGYSWELINKATTLTSGSKPAAEFKVYNGAGTLANATVDVTLKGPKAA